jgi:hypothetical protein
MGDLGDRLNIDEPHVRIGRGFEIDDTSLAEITGIRLAGSVMSTWVTVMPNLESHDA